VDDELFNDINCTECGTIERPHYAKGKCYPCYRKAWDAQQRAYAKQMRELIRAFA
jgi:hypothetical protein